MLTAHEQFWTTDSARPFTAVEQTRTYLLKNGDNSVEVVAGVVSEYPPERVAEIIRLDQLARAKQKLMSPKAFLTWLRR